MSMTYDQWKAQNIAAGGRGLRGVYDQWQASIPGSGVQQSAAPGELGGGTYGTTVDQVRATGQQPGKSEDYERFQDPEVQQWLSRWPYNPQTGKFTNKWGDQVDKPDERGPNTPPGYNGTGDYFGPGAFDEANAPGGQPQQGVPGGQPGAPVGQTGLYDPSNPLQNQLIALAQRRGGLFGEMGDQQGRSPISQALAGQGVWTMDPDQAPNPLDPSPVQQASPAQAIQTVAQGGNLLGAQAPPARAQQPLMQSHVSTAVQPQGGTAQGGWLGSTAQSLQKPQPSPLTAGLIKQNNPMWWKTANRRNDFR